MQFRTYTHKVALWFCWLRRLSWIVVQLSQGCAVMRRRRQCSWWSCTRSSPHMCLLQLATKFSLWYNLSSLQNTVHCQAFLVHALSLNNLLANCSDRIENETLWFSLIFNYTIHLLYDVRVINNVCTYVLMYLCSHLTPKTVQRCGSTCSKRWFECTPAWRIGAPTGARRPFSTCTFCSKWSTRSYFPGLPRTSKAVYHISNSYCMIIKNYTSHTHTHTHTHTHCN